MQELIFLSISLGLSGKDHPTCVVIVGECWPSSRRQLRHFNCVRRNAASFPCPDKIAASIDDRWTQVYYSVAALPVRKTKQRMQTSLIIKLG